MGRENGAGRREKLDDGGRGPTWLPTAGSARAVQLGLYCNGNAVFTYAGEGWGFCLVTLAKLLSSNLKATPAKLLKSRCVQVSPTPSSASPPRRSTRGSAASCSRPTPSTPRCGRIVLNAYALLPTLATIKLLDSCKPSPHPSPVIAVGLLPTAAAQRPPHSSLSVTGHRTPFP
uniref:Uncharacterized protein n=1 Tax=Oryza nivara TaxID=4536 RepID=A0A0E0GMQ8_ORYNI